jgi:hypothetical protein
MTKYALRFQQLARLRAQAAHRRDIRARGIDAALEPYTRPRVPAQRRSSGVGSWP